VTPHSFHHVPPDDPDGRIRHAIENVAHRARPVPGMADLALARARRRQHARRAVVAGGAAFAVVGTVTSVAALPVLERGIAPTDGTPATPTPRPAPPTPSPADPTPVPSATPTLLPSESPEPTVPAPKPTPWPDRPGRTSTPTEPPATPRPSPAPPRPRSAPSDTPSPEPWPGAAEPTPSPKPGS
jgi:hypothetical protein